MQALKYSIQTSFKNNLKKYLRKPVTYVIIVFVAIYIVSASVSIYFWADTLTNAGIRQTAFLVMVMVVFLTYTSGLWGIANQRAVIFKTADVHFVFSGPISPKMALVYSYFRNLVTSAVVSIALFLAGTFLLRIDIVTMLVVFVAVLLMEICEVAIVIIVYGNQSERNRIADGVRTFVKAVIVFVVAYFLYMYFIENVGLDATAMINNPILFCVPFIGWAIGMFYGIFIEVSLLSIIVSVLFVGCTIALSYYALTLTSHGEYYEEASAFADEYQERMKKAKRGQVQISWKKKKLKKANIEYKGNGAKAILYRQMLEYKKSRFFIFGLKSLINLVLGIAIAFFMFNNPEILEEASEFLEIRVYALLGIMMYYSFLSSGYQTKWAKEVDVMYTFLIPDTAIKKLWYSTFIEHIRACTDSLFLVIPASIGLQLSVMETLGCMGIYIVIETTKLYVQIICQTIVQVYIGKTIASFVSMVIQSLIYVLGLLVFFVANNTVSLEFGLLATILAGIIVTWLLCVLASSQFDRMETAE